MSDIQCILCKYKNNEKKCMEMMQNSSFSCPTLSNIYYGKLIGLPVIKQLYYLSSDIKQKMEERNYISDYETTDVKFVWGAILTDDPSDKPRVNLYTMNDIEVIYHKKERKFSISIETAYVFSNAESEKTEALTQAHSCPTYFHTEKASTINLTVLRNAMQCSGCWSRVIAL